MKYSISSLITLLWVASNMSALQLKADGGRVGNGLVSSEQTMIDIKSNAKIKQQSQQDQSSSALSAKDLEFAEFLKDKAFVKEYDLCMKLKETSELEKCTDEVKTKYRKKMKKKNGV